MIERVRKRFFSLLLCLCMILGMTDWSTLSVQAEGPIDITTDSNLTIKLPDEPAGGYIYTGGLIQPNVQVLYGTSDVDAETDVTFPDSDAGAYVVPGTYTIRVTGDGVAYTGSQDFEFTIGKVPLSSTTNDPIADKDYDPGGGNILINSDELVLYYNGNKLVYGTDFFIDRHFNNSSTGNVSKGASVQLMALNNSYFTGTKRIDFQIIRRDLASGDLRIDPELEPYVYDGTQKKPEPTVYDGDKLLTKSVHYSLSYDTPAINPGWHSVILKGAGVYSGTEKTVKFLIEKKLDHADISAEVDPNADLTFTGSPVEPKLIVKDKNQILTEGIHYTVEYTGNTVPGNIATATIYGVPDSGYTYERVLTYQVDALDVDDAGNDLVIDFDEYIYNGKEQKPAPTITYKGQVINPNDYFVDYGSGNKTDVGTVTVNVIFDGALKGDLTANYNIIPKSLKDDDGAGSISVTYNNYNPDNPPIYTGSPIVSVTPIVVYTNSTGETFTLTSSDFDTKYTGNTNASNSTPAQIEIIGKGNYRNSTFLTFNIGKKDISGALVEGIVENRAYTGNEIQQSLTVKMVDYLRAGNDYSVKYINATNVGIATIEIYGEGNYTGKIVRTFNITKVPLNDGNISISNILPVTYNGNEIKPTVQLSYNGKSLVEGQDYELEYSNNTNASENGAIVTIKAVPDEAGKVCNFSGSTQKTFTINPLNIAEQTGRYVVWNGLNPTPPVIYTGTPRTLDELVIQYKKAEVELNLTNLIDYTVSYEDNTEIGTATVTVTAKEGGNYTGTVSETFKIYGNLGNTNNTIVKMRDGREVYEVVETYTGDEITLDLYVESYGKELKEGTDYRVNYNDSNINAGTVNVTIEAIEEGFYYGTQSTTFTIAKKDISEEPYLDVTIPDKVYTAAAIIPDLTASYNGHQLVQGESGEADTDFYIECSDNINVGDTAKVTIFAQGNNFTGQKEELFTILPRDISDGASGEEYIQIDNLEDIIYRGEEHVVQNEGNLVVRFDKPSEGFQNLVLTSDDFEISYEENTKVGKAYIVITAKEGGNFKGTIKRSFKILGDLADIDIASIDPYYYSGLENKPTPDITYTCGIMQDELLVKDVDYELIYNEHIIEASENGGTIYSIPTVTVKGINYYSGTRQKTFTILPKNLSEDLEGIEFLDIKEEGYEYTRFDIHPDFRIENHGTAMDLSTDDGVTGDYLIKGYENVRNAAVKEDEMPPSIFIQGVGRNYIGETTLTFDIVPRKITADTVRVVGENEDGSIVYKMDGTDKMDYVDLDTYLEYPVLKVYYIENKGLPNEEEILLTEGDPEGDPEEYTIEYKDNNSPGKATMSIIGHGNYDLTYDKFFKVTANIENDSYTDILSIPPQYYAGNVIGAEPKPTVIVAGEELKLENNDYTLTYFKNTDLGFADDADPTLRPGVLIDATDSEFYSGKRMIYFDIVQRDLSDREKGMEGIEIVGINPDGYTYTGSQITFPFKLYNHTDEMIPDEEYSYYFENNTAASETDPCIVITGMGDYYRGTVRIPFKIVRKTGLTVDRIEDQEFTGSAIQPVPVVRIDGGEPLKPNIDYDIVSYENNTNVADRMSAAAPKVVIEGKGNYQGTVERTFSITKKSLENNSETDYFEIEVIGNDVYTGASLIPELEITRVLNGDRIPLTNTVDYMLSAGTECINAGAGNVWLEGIGNYSGGYMYEFTIKPLDVQKVIEPEVEGEEPIEVISFDPIASVEFDGADKTPGVVVRYYDEASGLYRELLPEEGGRTNYTIEYAENLNAGEATVTLIGAGNFTNTKSTTFTITSKSLEDADIPAFEFPGEYAHTGKGIVPRPSNESEIVYNGYLLTYLKDYQIVATDNVKVGTASYQVVGIGNFHGTLNGSFLIKGDLANASIEAIGLQQYTGAAVKPPLKVSFYGDALVEGTHFEVEYEANVKVGKAKATITPVDGSNYLGTKSIEFVISQNFASELVVTGIAKNYVYTGAAIKPIPAVVSIYGEVLRLGRDYQLTYKQNVSVGTAVITITGIGYLKGSKAISYKIVPKSIARASASSIASQVYSGKTFIPLPVVKDGSATLVRNRDYSLVYTNNQSPGRATITINGKGNYSGVKKTYFNITIPQVKTVIYAASTTTKIKLKWTKLAGVTGYEIYDSRNKLVTKIKKNTNTVTISNANAAKLYKYKVRGYVIKGNKITFGKFSPYITVTSKPKTPAIAVRSTTSKRALIRWKKLAGVSGYEVYQSTKKTGKYSRVAITAKSSYTKTRLTSKRTYYYRVRAYKTVNKKKIYSAYSAIKSIKVK